jgi:hypothetical protein
MAVYAMSVTTADLDEGASQLHSSSTGDNNLLSFGRGGPGAPVLNEIVSRTVSDVVDHSPAIHTADALHVTPKVGCWCYTFLDSGASENCFVSRKCFLTYEPVAIEGSTAVKGGRFTVAGKGLAEMTVQISDGSVHKIHVEALHTPGFAMNLISLPTLDTRGFHGEWGNGMLSVRNREGKLLIDGRLARSIGSRKLYDVDVVDDLDGQRPPVTAIAGRD